jgi:ribosomal-protein-alanine N-acetyltransferase
VIRRRAAEFADGRSACLLMLDRAARDGAVIGRLNFTEIVRGPFRACILGYAVDRAYEGRGYMFEGLRAAIAWVFGELRLHRIMANYRPENERSGRLLERLGFVREGYARDYLFIDGAWRDHVLTALTNPDPELAQVLR